MTSTISEHYDELLKQLKPYKASVVAVSKRQPLEKIQTLYDLGHRDFGENRVQEFLEKYLQLPQDIKWHLIGHLQTNKVRSIIGKAHLIHSVDRLKLARKINEESSVINRRTPILLQLKIAQEESKFGYSFEALKSQLKDGTYDAFEYLDIRGVMGMATFTEDENQIRQEFNLLRMYFYELKQEFFHSSTSFKDISMGMSGDYPIALEEGATIVRIGSLIFGKRMP